MTWSNGIKSKMVEFGYTVEEIAKQLNLSRQTLSRKINNKTDFTATEIRLLSEILNIEDKDTYFFNKDCSRMEHRNS